MITIDDFAKLEIRVGTIESVEEIPGSEKLYKFAINLGEFDPETNLPAVRQVLGGLKLAYKKEDLLNQQVLVLANLAPRTMMGLESHGMILAATDDSGAAVIIQPLKPVPNGSKIK